MMSPVWHAGICGSCSVGVRRLANWRCPSRGAIQERLLKPGFEAKLKRERVALISHLLDWRGGNLFCVRLSRSLEILTGDTLKWFEDCRNYNSFAQLGRQECQLLSSGAAVSSSPLSSDQRLIVLSADPISRRPWTPLLSSSNLTSECFHTEKKGCSHTAVRPVIRGYCHVSGVYVNARLS